MAERPYLPALTPAHHSCHPDGLGGALPALIGGESQGTWYVAAFDVEGERLEMHRARLATPDSGTEVVK